MGLLGIAAVSAPSVSSEYTEGLTSKCRRPGCDLLTGERFALGVLDGTLVHEEAAGVHLAAQARLDNRGDLLRELAGKGFEVTHGSEDSEIMLAAYLAWGPAFVERCYGDFALALWDHQASFLLLARDLMGIQPLYFTELDGHFAFASEPHLLLALPGVGSELDELQIGLFLAGEAPDSHRSFFQQIRQIAPGDRRIVDRHGVRSESYWDAGRICPLQYKRREEYAAHLRYVLEQCVESRLPRTEAPVGVAMSGGLDSCSIAALACRFRENQGTSRPLALSFVFPEHPTCDESEYLDLMESTVGVRIRRISAEQLWVLEEAAPEPDSPFTLWDAALREMLSELRAAGGKVLLTGHGADDLFAGTSLVLAARLQAGDFGVVSELIQAVRRRDGSVAKALYHHLARPFLPPRIERGIRALAGREDHTKPPVWLEPRLARQLKQYRTSEPFSWDLRGRARRRMVDVTTRHRFYAHAVDWYRRKGSAVGVEVRHPFLDRRLVEWVLAVPPEHLYLPGKYKDLLRLAVRDLLPESICCRKDKTSLVAFVDTSLRNGNSLNIKSLLQSSFIARQGLVDATRLEGSFRAYNNETSQPHARHWLYAAMVEIWLQRHLVRQDRYSQRGEGNG